MRRRLAAWTPDAASLDSVAFNRLEDIAKASGLPANEQSAPNSILALIGVDPFSGLRPAVREMERSRILGERAIYYAERTPMLLDLQTRALGAAVADMPETRSVLATANLVGESAALLADTVVTLPETFSKEREATIEQLLTAMEQQQGVMRELVVEVRQSLEAVPKASDSIRGVLDGTDALLRRLKVGEPPPPGSVPGRPFDITEYTQAAATIGDAAKQLQMLVTMLEHDAPAATRPWRRHAKSRRTRGRPPVRTRHPSVRRAVPRRAADRAHLAPARGASGTAGCKKNLCGGQGALIVASEPGRGPCEAVAEASHTSAGGAHLDGGWDVASSLSRGLRRHRCGSLPWKRQMTPSL